MKEFSLYVFFIFGTSFISWSQIPLDHEVLKGVFPKKIQSCKIIGTIESASLNMESMQVSNASVNYASNNVLIEIVFMDYYGSESAYKESILTGKLESGVKLENTISNNYIIDSKEGWLIQHIDAKFTTLLVTWDNRFYLKISINGNTDKGYINSVYEELDLSTIK